MPKLAPPVIFLAFASVSIAEHVDLPRLADEQRRVREALDAAARARRCVVVERPNVTLDEIVEVFQDDRNSGRIAVLHYAGHADGYSLLMQDGLGKALQAGAAGLAEFLSVQPGLKLVFLNACSTEEQVSALHAAGVPAVVATHEDIPDNKWVVTFAETFYRGLAGGKPISAAFTEAKAAKWSAEFGEREEQDTNQWNLFAVSDEALAWFLPLAPVAQVAAAGREWLWVNVPARPSHLFVGREQKLAELVDRLTTSQRPAAAMSGPAGTGKTALAVEVAHDRRITAHFTDGVLWGGLGTQPDPATILNQWATALKVELAGIPSLPDRSQRLSNAIGERKVLVVLDDAWDADVPELLKLSAPNVVHLLTTRSLEIAETFAGADMAMELPVLDAAAGFALLQMLAPAACAADPAAARSLVQTADNLPQVIMVLGGYLHTSRAKYFAKQSAQSISQAGNPATRLALATRRLGAAAGRKETLAETISLSLVGLSEAAQQTFYALGAFAAKPARFDLDAASAVTGADADTLGALIDRYLVEIDDARQMALQQVVADVARTQTSPQVEARHREFYLALARENPDDWQRIEAIYGQIKRAWEVVSAQESTLGFIWPLQSYQKRRGLWKDLLAWLERALAFAQAEGRQPIIEQLLGSLGLAYHDLGKNRQAIDYLNQALAIARAGDNRQGEGIHLGSLGLAYFDLDEVEEAIRRLQDALAIAREIGDRRSEGSHLGSLALIRRRQGLIPDAVAYLEQALALARASNDRNSEASHLDNLGLAHYDLDEMNAAIACFEQALEIARELGDRRSENHQLGNLGLACQRLGQDEEAVGYLERAAAIAQEIDDLRHQSRHLGNLANLYRRRQQTEQAIETYQQAIRISREIGDRSGESSHLGNLGNLYRNLGQAQQAIGYYEQALAIAREINNERAQGRQLGSLGLAYCDLTKIPQAIGYLEQALAVTRKCHDRPGESSHLGSLGLANHLLGQDQAAIDRLEQALTVAREISDRRLEASHLGMLGVVYQHAGRIPQAIQVWEDSLRICRALKDPRREAQILLYLGDLHADQGQPRQALAYYEQALAYYEQALAAPRQAGDKAGERVARRKIAVTASALDDLARAAAEMEQVVALAEATGHPDLESDRSALEELRARKSSNSAGPAQGAGPAA